MTVKTYTRNELQALKQRLQRYIDYCSLNHALSQSFNAKFPAGTDVDGLIAYLIENDVELAINNLTAADMTDIENALKPFDARPQDGFGLIRHFADLERLADADTPEGEAMADKLDEPVTPDNPLTVEQAIVFKNDDTPMGNELQLGQAARLALKLETIQRLSQQLQQSKADAQARFEFDD